jgi:IS30 family transposase
MVERKSGYAVMAKVVNKTSDLVGSAIVNKLKPLAARVKTLTYDNGKEFAGHGQIDEQLQNTRRGVSSIPQARCASYLNAPKIKK